MHETTTKPTVVLAFAGKRIHTTFYHPLPPHAVLFTSCPYRSSYVSFVNVTRYFIVVTDQCQYILQFACWSRASILSWSDWLQRYTLYSAEAVSN